MAILSSIEECLISKELVSVQRRKVGGGVCFMSANIISQPTYDALVKALVVYEVVCPDTLHKMAPLACYTCNGSGRITPYSNEQAWRAAHPEYVQVYVVRKDYDGDVVSCSRVLDVTTALAMLESVGHRIGLCETWAGEYPKWFCYKHPQNENAPDAATLVEKCVEARGMVSHILTYKSIFGKSND